MALLRWCAVKQPFKQLFQLFAHEANHNIQRTCKVMNTQDCRHDTWAFHACAVAMHKHGSSNAQAPHKLESAYMKSLLTNCAVLFLQEHWLSVDQLRLLNDIDAEFQCIGVSGFDNSDILSGRPFGGCAMLWRSDLLVTVNTLSACSRRVCAIRMASDYVKLLFINVYMPYEGDDEMSAEFRRSVERS
jgi:hypothetical protein